MTWDLLFVLPVWFITLYFCILLFLLLKLLFLLYSPGEDFIALLVFFCGSIFSMIYKISRYSYMSLRSELAPPNIETVNLALDFMSGNLVILLARFLFYLSISLLFAFLITPIIMVYAKKIISDLSYFETFLVVTVICSQFCFFIQLILVWSGNCSIYEVENFFEIAFFNHLTDFSIYSNFKPNNCNIINLQNVHNIMSNPVKFSNFSMNFMYAFQSIGISSRVSKVIVVIHWISNILDLIALFEIAKLLQKKLFIKIFHTNTVVQNQ